MLHPSPVMHPSSALPRSAPRPLWWRWARAARHTPDRLLHAWRRRRALTRLARTAPPTRVLVVCHGNICRSPYAAGRLRSLFAAQRHAAEIQSAGFIGPDRPAPGNAVTTAALRGVDLTSHRSRLLTAQLVDDAELIVVMDARQAAALRFVFGDVRAPILILGDLDPLPAVTRAVRDPALEPRAVFAESYDRIDRCLAALVATVA